MSNLYLVRETAAALDEALRNDPGYIVHLLAKFIVKEYDNNDDAAAVELRNFLRVESNKVMADMLLERVNEIESSGRYAMYDPDNQEEVAMLRKEAKLLVDCDGNGPEDSTDIRVAR